MSFRVFSRLFPAVAILCCYVPTASAVDGARLVATSLQDEPRTIPEDNTAVFSRVDRKVRFQLVKFSGATSDMLAGTSVTVIDPNGTETRLTADAEGFATLEDAKPGLHALVVTGENGHIALPMALREGDVPAVDENDPALAAAPAVKLPLMDIDPSELVRVTSSYLAPGTSGAYEDIDSEFVSTGQVTQGLQYRVRLGNDGTLEGQVLSMLRSGLTTYGVEGTNILIYRGNELVQRTIADKFGKFTVGGMVPGVYGLCGIGAAGYAAFGFEAYNAAAIAQSGNGHTLVSVAKMQAGSVLPVVLIPPAMVPAVVRQIRDASPPFFGDAGAPGFPGGGGFGAPGGVGAGAPAGFGGGFGGAAGGAAGGLGGAGGLLGLAAIGGIAAAVLGSNDDNNDDFVPAPATNARL